MYNHLRFCSVHSGTAVGYAAIGCLFNSQNHNKGDIEKTHTQSNIFKVILESVFCLGIIELGRGGEIKMLHIK